MSNTFVYSAIRGSSGYSGLTGNTGVQGAQGAKGSTGAQGAAGAQGLTGAQGASGYSGFSGLNGVQGSIGNQGTSGYSGFSGATGAQGTNGTVGSNGAQGASGYSGFSGLKGSTGAQGTAGTNGAQGTQGTAGTNGIQGAQGASGYSGFSGAFAGTGVSGYGAMFTGTNSLSANSFFFLSGNVGIGTSSPAYTLDLSGSARIVTSLGVGTTPSGTTGEIRATGNITAYYSDDRLKTKLGVIENALDKICSLEGFYYEANETAQALGYEPVREVGISAQATQKVLPEIVAPAPIDEKYLTIRYERMVPLLIQAIKELREEVKALK